VRNTHKFTGGHGDLVFHDSDPELLTDADSLGRRVRGNFMAVNRDRDMICDGKRRPGSDHSRREGSADSEEAGGK
jgi:hypothetical protein